MKVFLVKMEPLGVVTLLAHCMNPEVVALADRVCESHR